MEKDNDSMVVKQEAALYAPSEYSSSEAPPVSRLLIF